MDSFSAFEEVLYLAKKFKCDMVLLAGDLFHENQPTRHTLHRTIQILRKYCMGDDAVRVEVLSDPSNLRSGQVNYADKNFSVDLPIFSIHGNHDDPIRDNKGESLAALDLLSAANLVNYFGRQEKIDEVSVSPVLLRKGTTRVGLYGLGSMRDERLNRTWQNQKVRFLKPEDDDFFHIFALHQNRDLGRGRKNCVQESMIPEWMDLVMWGHEHECWIDFCESVVGTFRITQPGSSVATSLVPGEAVRKKVGVLDIKSGNFRMHKVPLTQVRSFVTTEVVLKEQNLDPLDPKIDKKIGNLLEQQVRVLIVDAREKRKQLLEDAAEAGNDANQNDSLINMMQNPDQVLVRVRVDHSEFSSINNQRFGAQFVGDVANPSTVLLFSRKKAVGGSTKKQKEALKAMSAPITPEELEQTNMQDIVQQFLELPEQQLTLLDETLLSEAMEEFVDKSLIASIAESSSRQLEKKQKLLHRTSVGSVKSHSDARDFVKEDVGKATVKKKRVAGATSIDDLDEEDESETAKKTRRGKAKAEEDEDEDMDDQDSSTPTAAKKKPSRSKATKISESKRKENRRQRIEADLSDEEDDYEFEAAPSKTKTSSKASARPKRGTRKRKSVLDSFQEEEDNDYEEESEAQVDDDDSDDVLVVDDSPPKRKAKPATAKKRKAPTRRRNFTSSFGDDDSEEEGFGKASNPIGIGDDDDDWGTAVTKSQH